MFKLVKILGQGTNTPEIIPVSVGRGNPIRKNALYYIASNNLSPIKENAVSLPFIPVEELKEGHDRTTVNGYLVTSNMIFEADTEGDFTYKCAGDGITFYMDEDEIVEAVAADSGEDGTIISMDNYHKAKKVLAVFNV